MVFAQIPESLSSEELPAEVKLPIGVESIEQWGRVAHVVMKAVSSYCMPL
jgi:hypothetical protein